MLPVERSFNSIIRRDRAPRCPPAQLTATGAGPIVGAMPNDPKFRSELKQLEERLEEVLELCGKLTEENRSLRDNQEQLVQEKASLVQRNEQVRTRVEAMITRLKSLEQGQ